VQIRACSLTAAGRDVRSSVEAVLRHAGVKAGEIQLVEAHGSSPTDDKSELLHNTEANQASRPQEPLKGFDTTGLAGLCGIGEFPRDKCIEGSRADISLHSLAASWLVSQAQYQTTDLLAAHLNTRGPGFDSSTVSLRWTGRAGIPRRTKSARWPRTARIQPCRRDDERYWLEDGRREVQGGR
jgi:hypothetical protein